MNWKLITLVSIFTPVFIGLGIWQLMRAEEKRISTSSFEVQQRRAPVEINELPTSPAQYTRFELTGHFLNVPTWLLDNQMHKGKFGYRVFAPFCINEKTQCVLVERGWIQGSLKREVLPDVFVSDDTVKIQGRVDYLTINNLIDDNEPFSHWPYRVQKLNIEELRNKVDVPLATWVVRLDEDQPGLLTRVWQPVVMGSEKHTGYAVQWFALAVTLIGLTGWRWWQTKASDN